MRRKPPQKRRRQQDMHQRVLVAEMGGRVQGEIASTRNMGPGTREVHNLRAVQGRVKRAERIPKGGGGGR